MASIDSYADIKDRYFEKAQNNNGAVARIITILNEFVRKFDEIRNTAIKEKEKIAKVYIDTSDQYVQENKRISDNCHAEIQVIRDDARTKVHDKVQAIRDKIVEIIGSPMPDGAMNDVTMIRSFSGMLSDSEIQVFLEKYKKNYLVTKAIFEGMSEDQRKRLGVKFISADDVAGSLDSIEESALNVIRTYNGVFQYDFALILNGSWVQTVNDAFEAFVYAYAK